MSKTTLVKYEAARHALAVAVSIDEVQRVKNAAEQAILYARQAKDQDLIANATEIRVRAQRRAGEMLAQAAKDGQRAKAGANQHQRSSPPATTSATLAQIGITKNESSRYQKLAAIPPAEFEEHVATARSIAGEVNTAFILSRTGSSKPASDAIPVVNDDAVATAKTKEASHGEQALAFYNAIRALGGLTCNAAELRAALPTYQHFRITENIGHALALLQEVRKTWKQ